MICPSVLFFEYNYDNLDDFQIVAGVRGDYHNNIGWFITPRVHLRYNPWEKSVFRLSAGMGRRIANIFAENQKLFGSSRSIVLQNTDRTAMYGLNPEIAYNYGTSFRQGFYLFDHKADITVDLYRTDFKNQVVVDWEEASKISFYNLKGDSYATSFQVLLNLEPLNNFKIRTAYKYYDVQTQYKSGKKIKPLNAKHRYFLNLEYNTPFNKLIGKQWKFDLTIHWVGQQRLPFERNSTGTAYTTLNTQITRIFSPAFEMYIGGENITNIKQKNPIFGAQNPFGDDFDSTQIYSPIFGDMYYIGLRYQLN